MNTATVEKTHLKKYFFVKKIQKQTKRLQDFYGYIQKTESKKTENISENIDSLLYK